MGEAGEDRQTSKGKYFQELGPIEMSNYGSFHVSEQKIFNTCRWSICCLQWLVGLEGKCRMGESLTID